MSLAKLEKLKEQAARMRRGLDRSGSLSEATDKTLSSFEGNLDKMAQFNQKVARHDAELQATLAAMGNFDPGELLGEGGEKSAEPSSKPDVNGVRVNPEHRQ